MRLQQEPALGPGPTQGPLQSLQGACFCTGSLLCRDSQQKLWSHPDLGLKPDAATDGLCGPGEATQSLLWTTDPFSLASWGLRMLSGKKMPRASPGPWHTVNTHETAAEFREEGEDGRGARGAGSRTFLSSAG